MATFSWCHSRAEALHLEAGVYIDELSSKPTQPVHRFSEKVMVDDAALARKLQRAAKPFLCARGCRRGADWLVRLQKGVGGQRFPSRSPGLSKGAGRHGFAARR